MSGDTCPTCLRVLSTSPSWEPDPVAPQRQRLARWGGYVMRVNTDPVSGIAVYTVDKEGGGLKGRGFVTPEEGPSTSLAQERAEMAAMVACHAAHG